MEDHYLARNAGGASGTIANGARAPDGAAPLDAADKDRKIRPARMGQLGSIEDAADGTAMLIETLEGILSSFEEGLRQG